MIKECPMCGEKMRIKERDLVDRVPGTAQTKRTRMREWVCPECDYFEDADEEAG